MADSGIKPKVVAAAFFFGILFTAASAATAARVVGHGIPKFRDGSRLALCLFLTLSAFWALFSFVTTLLNQTQSTACQVVLIFSSLSDQLARCTIEQYLIWAMNKGRKSTGPRLLPQVVLVGRLVAGIAFVALVRPGFSPSCVPVSENVPVPITVMALDAAILVMLALSELNTTDQGEGARSRAVGLIATGLAIWIGLSVPMLLGMNSIAFLLRTLMPAIALSLLIAIAMFFSGPIEDTPASKEDQLDSPTWQDINPREYYESRNPQKSRPSQQQDNRGRPSSSNFQGRAPPPNAARSAPRTYRGAAPLPKISRPVTGVAGIGGLPVQGQLFPPVMADTAGQRYNVQPMARPPRQGPGSRKGRPIERSATGKVAISLPVLKEGPEEQSSLNKIPTVDLATAYDADRRRRAAQAERSPDLVATRPAPPPPHPLREHSARKSVKPSNSTRRKAVESEASSGNPNNVPRGPIQPAKGLSAPDNATSTSAQLSPGVESLRKRSPRAMQHTSQSWHENQPPLTSAKTLRETRSPSWNHPVQATQLGRNSMDVTVVPVVLPAAFDSLDPARGRAVTKDETKEPQSGRIPLSRTDSILDRPRPIPRQKIRDRQVFPAEVHNGHRRSKSTGSNMNRKSALFFVPGKPPQPTPPVPEPPRSAAPAVRPLPNDTKSMTFNEKMFLLDRMGPASTYSSSMGSPMDLSPTPLVPPVPPLYTQPVPPVPVASRLEVPDARRITTTTDRSSIKTNEIFALDETTPLGPSWPKSVMPKPSQAEPGHGAVPSSDPAPLHQNETMQSELGTPRQDSLLIIPIVESQASSPQDFESPVDQTGLHKSHNGSRVVSMISVKLDTTAVESPEHSIHSTRDDLKRQTRELILESPNTDHEDEVMTVMLDTSSEHAFDNFQPRVSYDEISQHEQAAVEEHEDPEPSRFHNLLGRQCPSFSNRDETHRSRKMPPPAPLPLHAKDRRRKTISIQMSEPSPVESPGAAYQAIQAQLDNLDMVDQDLGQSEDQQRITLLQDLEREMGQQESKWQLMHVDMGRNSMSTIQTTSPAGTRPPSMADHESQRTVASGRRASYRSRIISGTSTTESISSNRVSLWKARLAEAQRDYMQNTAGGLMPSRSSVNFLTVSSAQLGSPSPPDTDDSGSECEMAQDQQQQTQTSPSLSSPTAVVTKLWTQSKNRLDALANDSSVFSSGLWVALQRPAPEIRDETVWQQLESEKPRLMTRKILDPLKIESSQLWNPKAPTRTSSESRGLWQRHVPDKRPEHPRKTPAKRSTLTRPPRRVRRMTALCDIIESPEPLTEKRESLGLFQFPWGERSEHATIQSGPSYMRTSAMPGTMTSRAAAAMSTASMAFNPESPNYSSSLIQDYEYDEGEYDSNDDEFDETLWEIANLLQTNHVPFGDDFLSRSEPEQTNNSSILGDFIPEFTTEDQLDGAIWGPEAQHDFRQLDYYETPVSPLTGNMNATDGLLDQSRDQQRIVSTTWGNVGEDLQLETARGNQFSPVTPASFSSSEATSEDVDLSPTSVAFPGANYSDENMRSALWSKPAVHFSTQRLSGNYLFSPDVAGVDHRRTVEEPAALLTATRPRSTREPAPRIETDRLWSVTPRARQNDRPSLLSSTFRLGSDQSHISEGSSFELESVPVATNYTWSKPESIIETSNNGLYDPTHVRADFRRSSKEPAASRMLMKPRTDKSGSQLPQIASSSLWGTKGPPRQKSAVLNLVWRKPDAVVETYTEGLYDPGHVRLDWRRSSKDPAASRMSTKPRKDNSTQLPQITSSSLWGAKSIPPQQLSASSLIWRKTEPIIETYIGGLYDPGHIRVDWRRSSKHPAAAFMQRKPRRVIDAPLANVTSCLWGTEGLPPQKSSVHSPVWKRPESVVDNYAGGLYDPSHVRPDWRRSSREPAATLMQRKPRRASDAPLAAVTSSLWTAKLEPQVNGIADGLWKQSMIIKPEKRHTLFELDPKRTDFRTTSAEPAALHLVKKPRAKVEPMQPLKSDRLWRKTSGISIDVNWLALSSVRVRSPSMRSDITSSSTWSVTQVSTPATDISSIRNGISHSHKPSSSIGSTKSAGGFFGSLFKRKVSQPETLTSQADSTTHLPSFAEEPEIDLDSIIRDLDAFPSNGASRSPVSDLSRQTSSASSTARPTRRPEGLQPADWDAALQEALKASRPLSRIQASPNQWDAALQQAIEAGHVARRMTTPRKTPATHVPSAPQEIGNSAVQHNKTSRPKVSPAQWQAELQEAMSHSQVERPTLSPLKTFFYEPY